MHFFLFLIINEWERNKNKIIKKSKSNFFLLSLIYWLPEWMFIFRNEKNEPKSNAYTLVQHMSVYKIFEILFIFFFFCQYIHRITKQFKAQKFRFVGFYLHTNSFETMSLFKQFPLIFHVIIYTHRICRYLYLSSFFSLFSYFHYFILVGFAN